MDCPRCDGALLEFALEDAAAFVCEGCGYVGVPADHTPEGGEGESWAEALRRFREAGGAERAAATVAIGGERHRVPPVLATAVDALTEKQRAVVRELLREPDPADPDRTYAEIAEAAGVTPGYAGEIVRKHGDLAAAVAATD